MPHGNTGKVVLLPDANVFLGHIDTPGNWTEV